MVEFRVCSSGMNDDGIESAVGEPLQYDTIPYAVIQEFGMIKQLGQYHHHDSSELGKKEKKTKALNFSARTRRKNHLVYSRKNTV